MERPRERWLIEEEELARSLSGPHGGRGGGPGLLISEQAQLGSPELQAAGQPGARGVWAWARDEPQQGLD